MEDIYCGEITAFTITVKWLHAPKAYIQGILTGYNLYYQKSTAIFNITNISPHRDSISVIGLEPFTEYHFQLAATTSVGEGNRSLIPCKTNMLGSFSYICFYKNMWVHLFSRKSVLCGVLWSLFQLICSLPPVLAVQWIQLFFCYILVHFYTTTSVIQAINLFKINFAYKQET